MLELNNLIWGYTIDVLNLNPELALKGYVLENDLKLIDAWWGTVWELDKQYFFTFQLLLVGSHEFLMQVYRKFPSLILAAVVKQSIKVHGPFVPIFNNLYFEHVWGQVLIVCSLLFIVYLIKEAS